MTKHASDSTVHLSKIVAQQEAKIGELELEIARTKLLLTDPVAVWVNMLRGTIARPRALDHYEECKQEVEKLQAELDRLKTPHKCENCVWFCYPTAKCDCGEVEVLFVDTTRPPWICGHFKPKRNDRILEDNLIAEGL